jgi:hypothetical protein
VEDAISTHVLTRHLMAALLVALAAPAVSARGQEAAETPEQVTQAFLQATRDTYWARMAALLHPTALAQFHSFFAPILQCQTPEADEARRQIFGLTSAVQTARTPDSVLVATLFRTLAGRDQGFADMLRTARLQMLGHVAEGPDTVHVVSRLTVVVDSMPVSQMEVVSLSRDGPTWRVLLKSDLSALAVMLRRVCSPRGT